MSIYRNIEIESAEHRQRNAKQCPFRGKLLWITDGLVSSRARKQRSTFCGKGTKAPSLSPALAHHAWPARGRPASNWGGARLAPRQDLDHDDLGSNRSISISSLAMFRNSDIAWFR
jgi:hypothetical protein